MFLKYEKIKPPPPPFPTDTVIYIQIDSIPKSDSTHTKIDSIPKQHITSEILDSVYYSMFSVKHRIPEFKLFIIDKFDTTKIEQIYPDPEVASGKIYFSKESKYLLKTLLNNKLCNIRELQPNDSITIPGGVCQ